MVPWHRGRVVYLTAEQVDTLRCVPVYSHCDASGLACNSRRACMLCMPIQGGRVRGEHAGAASASYRSRTSATGQPPALRCRIPGCQGSDDDSDAACRARAMDRAARMPAPPRSASEEAPRQCLPQSVLNLSDWYRRQSAMRHPLLTMTWITLTVPRQNRSLPFTPVLIHTHIASSGLALCLANGG